MDNLLLLISILIIFFLIIILLYFYNNYKIIEYFSFLINKESEYDTCYLINQVGKVGSYCDGIALTKSNIYTVENRNNISKKELEINLRNKLQDECNKNPYCNGFTTFVDNIIYYNKNPNKNFFVKNIKNYNNNEYNNMIKKNNINYRDNKYNKPIGKLCLDGWGGTLLNYPKQSYLNDNNLSYKDWLNKTKINNKDINSKEVRVNDYTNLKTYKCLDNCVAGEGIRKTKTKDEIFKYGKYMCDKCDIGMYSLSNEKYCKKCNNNICPIGTRMVNCDSKTGGVLCEEIDRIVKYDN